MFSIFKKKVKLEEKQSEFEIELTASILAYEIARSDGDITEDEKTLLLTEVRKISQKVGKDEEDILKLIENYSNDSVSFYEFIEDINKYFSKEDKNSLIRFLWDVAYADSNLDIDSNKKLILTKVNKLI